MSATDSRLLLLSSEDNILVLRATIDAGETITVSGVPVTIAQRIVMGHKLARRPISAGDLIVKYGVPIGTATLDIAVGEHVHLHNVRSNYTATYSLEEARATAGMEEQ
jgi:hypothetical protein